MGKRRICWSLCILDLYFCFALAAIFFPSCDARKSAYTFRAAMHPKYSGSIKRIKTLNRIDMHMPLDSSNSQPYGVSSPFSLPPYDSLPPIPLPENTPPFCIYPPFTPQPPSTTIPSPPAGGGFTPLVPPPPPMSFTPIVPVENPPPSTIGTVPSPPQSMPNPPVIFPNPPSGSVPSPFTTPPFSVPSPPMTNVPSPSGIVPRPPVYLPPIVYPTPVVPPPPHVAPVMALWCVAKPSVPEPIIQEAMNYACASGADCNQIQPSGSCFQPNTLLAHASYAFNSYWQRSKVAGGTCEFGGTAMLVTVDPSYDGCHFIYY